MMSVCFYVAYPYYFPHFLPISKELENRGYKVHYVLSDTQNTQLIEAIAKDNQLDYSIGEGSLFKRDDNFIFFANPYPEAKNLKAKTIFLEHGIGSKSMGFYSSIEYFDLYITEGSQKTSRLTELYPQHQHKIREVGFSKFDAIINMSESEKASLQHKYKLNPNKKTILYAPTFFPSSIEKMSDHFPDDLSEYNIVVKAHYLTYERDQYKKQRQKLSTWEKADNCHVVGVDEYNLVPFFALSDVMISDESSAMFEFACLDKPVVSNRYVKLRWSYYLMPWKLAKRIDKSKDKYRQILDNAFSYQETLSLTRAALENPSQKQDLRLSYSGEICGNIDGKVSQRIVDTLEHETL